MELLLWLARRSEVRIRSGCSSEEERVHAWSVMLGVVLRLRCIGAGGYRSGEIGWELGGENRGA